MADISKITLPSGTTYDIKDSTARAGVETNANAIKNLQIVAGESILAEGEKSHLSRIITLEGEVEGLIAGGLTYKIVNNLPTASKDTMGNIYMIAHTHTEDSSDTTNKDYYDEYMTILAIAKETKTYTAQDPINQGSSGYSYTISGLRSYWDQLISVELSTSVSSSTYKLTYNTEYDTWADSTGQLILTTDSTSQVSFLLRTEAPDRLYNLHPDTFTITTVQEGTTQTYSWEKIGNTDIDLSDYAQKGDNVTISSINGTAASAKTNILINSHNVTSSTFTNGQAKVTATGSNAKSKVKITPTTDDIYSMTSDGSVTKGSPNTPTVIDTSKFSEGTFTSGKFDGGSGSFTQGTFTPNTPTELDLTKFNKGSFNSGKFTPNTPTVIDTTKFNGGSGSFTQGDFDGGSGSFTQGTFTPNTPTKLDLTKFDGGSYSHTGFSGGSGSYTQGTFTPNTPTELDLSKFSEGSFTSGTFNPGSASLTVVDDTFTASTHTVSDETLVISDCSFTPGSVTLNYTAPTHADDAWVAPKLNDGFYTKGTAASHGADTHTHIAATYGTDSFTAARLGTGFYSEGTAASHAADVHTHIAATHGADVHTHTGASIATGFYIAGTAATHEDDSWTGPSFGTGFYTKGTAASHAADVHVHNAATHAADSFTSASLGEGFYTAGTAGTPTAVTLPGRSTAIKVWTGYTEGIDSTYAEAQTFTGTEATGTATGTVTVTIADHTITDNGHTHTVTGTGTGTINS